MNFQLRTFQVLYNQGLNHNICFYTKHWFTVFIKVLWLPYLLLNVLQNLMTLIGTGDICALGFNSKLLLWLLYPKSTNTLIWRWNSIFILCIKISNLQVAQNMQGLKNIFSKTLILMYYYLKTLHIFIVKTSEIFLLGSISFITAQNLLAWIFIILFKFEKSTFCKNFKRLV